MTRDEGVIYVEDARKALQVYLQGKTEWTISDGESTENFVSFVIKVRGYNIRVWFNQEKQAYGFDKAKGGSKSSPQLDKMIELLESYVQLNTTFLPDAQKISSALEKEVGIHSVYKQISGNLSTGYWLEFKVLGTDQILSIECAEAGTSSVYAVRLLDADGVEQDAWKYRVYADGDAVKCEDESVMMTDSEVDEPDVFDTDFENSLNTDADDDIFEDFTEKEEPAEIEEPIMQEDEPTEVEEPVVQKSTLELLADAWDDAEYVDGMLEVSTDNFFVCLIDDAGILYLQKLIRDEVLINVDNADIDLTVDMSQDDVCAKIMEVSDLVMTAIDRIKADVPYLELNATEGKFVGDEGAFIIELVDTVIQIGGMGVSDFISEHKPVVAEVEEPAPVVEEPAELDVPDEPTEVSDMSAESEPVPSDDKVSEIKVTQLWENGKSIGVRFTTPDAIYDCNIETAEACGLVIDRILDKSNIVRKNGLYLSDEEISMKLFSVDMSKDHDFIKYLIERVFTCE